MKKACILVSACLLGKNCKYNGSNNYSAKVAEFIKDYDVILICPEVMAGLSIPREPLEICNNRLITKEGADYTKNMMHACDEIKKIINKKSQFWRYLRQEAQAVEKALSTMELLPTQ